MLIEIRARVLLGGQAHEHVTEVEYRARDGRHHYAAAESVIAWLDRAATHVAVVYTPTRTKRFIVGIYRTPAGGRHLRTYTQRGWRDDILELPDIAEPRFTAEGAPPVPAVRWPSSARPVPPGRR
jgi:hypothetical protein